MSKTVALLALVIGVGACDGQSLPGEADPLGQQAVTPVPVTPDCVAGLTSGQSAIITHTGCAIIDAGRWFIPVEPVMSTWLGPHTELCYGPTADAPDVCEASSALSPTQGSAPLPAPETVVTSAVFAH